jgi:hypothetical protein
MAPEKKKVAMNFKEMARKDVPRGRNGKHRQIVDKILSDLDRTKIGAAIRIPLVELDFSKEKIRAALNRATRKSHRHVATASDDTFLYVWNESS